MLRPLPVVTALVALTLSAPASATTFKGHTNRNRAASLTTAPDGTVRRVIVHWRAGCREIGATYTSLTRFIEPFAHATPDAVSDRGYYRVDLQGPERARLHVAMTAKRVSEYRWTGTFRATAVVSRHGKVSDRCTLGRVKWSASVPQAAIHLESDAGDYIGGGGTVDVHTPQDDVPVTATKRSVATAAGGFGIQIEAPEGKSLKAGTSFSTTRYPFNDAGGGLDVSGNGRGCNESTGTVTVTRASFDRKGNAKHLELSFEQHCEGGDPALRGTLNYSA